MATTYARTATRVRDERSEHAVANLRRAPGVIAARSDAARGTATVLLDTVTGDELEVANEIHRWGLHATVISYPQFVSWGDPAGVPW
jgi:hypothetical protein